jgi:hypothetical protein
MRRRLVLGIAVLLALPSGPAVARVFMTQRQAIEAAFPPPAKVERRTLYLDADQARRASDEAGAPVEVRVVPYYVGTLDGRVSGYAYFDTHQVRTLAETVLILLSGDGRIKRIDIVSFEEPDDYLPPKRWLDQFPGRTRPEELAPGGGIRSVTGATLSARAVTGAARRVLALHRLFVAPAALGSGGQPPEKGAP